MYTSSRALHLLLPPLNIIPFWKLFSWIQSLHFLYAFLCLQGKKVKFLSLVWLFATTWTVACQAPLSMGFFRQEYWSGLSFPSPGDLPDLGIESRSPAFQADSTAWGIREAFVCKEYKSILSRNQRMGCEFWYFHFWVFKKYLFIWVLVVVGGIFHSGAWTL